MDNGEERGESVARRQDLYCSWSKVVVPNILELARDLALVPFRTAPSTLQLLANSFPVVSRTIQRSS